MRRLLRSCLPAAFALAATLAFAGAADATVRIPDHFKLYPLKQPDPPIPPQSIGLVDQFGGESFTLGRPRALGVPVQKFRESGPGAPIQRPNEHLKCYQIEGPDRAIPVRVVNQFRPEGSSLVVRAPRRVCTPALKNQSGEPPAEANHYKCYRVSGDPRPRLNESLSLLDQFGSQSARIGAARLLCNPATKISQHGVFTPPFPNEHLVCYRFRRAFTSPFEPRVVGLIDQFGRQTVSVRRPRALCVPSEKFPETGNET